VKAFRSTALTANLQETRRTVEIRPEQQVLLDITADWYGVNKRVRAFLTELNHPLANWEVVVKDLRTAALGDLHRFLNHQHSPKAVAVFLQVFRHLFSVELSPPLKRELLRTLLEFLSALLKSPQAESFEAQVYDVLGFLAIALPDRASLWAKASALLHRASSTFRPFPRLAASFDDLLRQSLAATYQHWLERCDLVGWHNRNRELFSPGSDYQGELASLCPDNWRQRIAQAEAAQTAEELTALPDYSALVDMAIQAAEEIAEPADRAQFLLYFLDNELFAGLEHRLLSRLIACLRTIGQSDSTAIEGFVHRFFSLLEGHDFEHKAIAMNCALTLGQELDRRGESDLLNTFIDRLVRFPFEPPDVRGVTDQWEVMVNPNHLPNVRLLMRLAEQNPSRYRRLLSVLVVQLAISGLFVADTDLFQKDVTQLLNADIGPVYNKVKQLARMFPVYFTEIGAEGELRDTSTDVDQVQERRDPLIHFLRKQVHVESNSTQVTFTRQIIRFWTTGDKSPLEAWLPPDVYQAVQVGGPCFDQVHRIFRTLDRTLGFPDYLSQDYESLACHVDEQTGVPAQEKTRAKLLLRLHKLLEQKYSFGTEGIADRIRRSGLIHGTLAERLLDRLSNGNPLETLHATLDVLEALKKIILDPEVSQGDERIYHKRHVAVGIPSMYGMYRERKFEALGLTFRLEALARRLYAELISSINLRYVTKKTLLDIHEILTLLVQALCIDGMHSASLENNLNLLAMGLQAQDFSVEQLVNVFQFIAADVHELTNRYVLNVHTGTAEIILAQRSAADVPPNPKESVYSLSEKLLRRLITACFGLQDLDDLVGKILMALTNMRQQLDDRMLLLLMSYDPYRLLSSIHGDVRPYDNPLHLGSKGYFLKQLVAYGLPVPEGFIVTTELFRCQTAMSFAPWREDTMNRIREYLTGLESTSGKRFGDPGNPLLLSVRSGAVMSMPGMMNTFLNVGLNDEISQAFGEQEKYAWAVWDSYRRLIQSWAMSHGVDRDLFDEAIQGFKQRYGVEKKMEFSPEHMRQIAFHYKEIMSDHGVRLTEEPFDQLVHAIQIVLRSWFSDRAADYRERLGIAEQWGTAAIVQCMVFGNLNKRSGSGVILTRNPLGGDTPVELYGDYNLCSQGEDVVSGLVNPLPISEAQRRLGAPGDGGPSLEQHFPAIFQRLKGTASLLIDEQGYAHQEIEFTFESEQPKDLFVLQTRNMVYSEQERVQVFVASEALKDALLGRGIGAGGGVLSGRVAFTGADIHHLRTRNPGCAIILARPDTVPDDFALIAQADGLLTARGGLTSHAAVAAHRLGKTCVVNCRSLHVYEQRQEAELNGHTIRFGDTISIDGRQGTIYAGEFPVQYEDIIL
jgi:pyruvate,orthophosphate dikinase